MTAEIIGIVFGNKHGLSREANFNYWKDGSNSKLIDREKDIRGYLDINTHGYTFYSLDFIEKYVVWSVYKIIFDTQGREASDWLVMSLVFSNEYWINQSFINQANKIFDDFGNEVLVHGRIQKPPYNAEDYLNRAKDLAGYLDAAPAYREIDVPRDTKSNRVGIIDILDQDAIATICHFYPGSNNSLSEFFFLPGSGPFNLKGSAELISALDLNDRYNTAQIKSVLLSCGIEGASLKVSYNGGAEKSVSEDTPLYLMPGDSIKVRGEAIGYDIYPIERRYSDIGDEPLKIPLKGETKITKYTITTVPKDADIYYENKVFKSGTMFDLIFDKSYKFTISAEGYKDKTIELWGSNEKFVTKVEVLESEKKQKNFELIHSEYPNIPISDSKATKISYSINNGNKSFCKDQTPSFLMAVGDVVTFWKDKDKGKVEIGQCILTEELFKEKLITIKLKGIPVKDDAPIKSDGKKGSKIQGKNNPGSLGDSTKSTFLSLLKANAKPLILGLSFGVMIAALIIVISKIVGGDGSISTDLIEVKEIDASATAGSKANPRKDTLSFTFNKKEDLENFPVPTVKKNGRVTNDYNNKFKWNPSTLQEGKHSYTVTIDGFVPSETVVYQGNDVELSKKAATQTDAANNQTINNHNGYANNANTKPDPYKDYSNEFKALRDYLKGESINPKGILEKIDEIKSVEERKEAVHLINNTNKKKTGIDKANNIEEIKKKLKEINQRKQN
jgi:hypothetical protein